MTGIRILKGMCNELAFIPVKLKVKVVSDDQIEYEGRLWRRFGISSLPLRLPMPLAEGALAKKSSRSALRRCRFL